jgi:hypothetical protein
MAGQEEDPAGADLPFVDEHAVSVAARPEAAWEGLLAVAERSFAGAAAPRFARAVGCEDTAPSGPRPLAVGSTLPGFHVSAADGSVLSLRGRHRFSRYALVFHLDDLGGGRSRLRAETRAEFPGLTGSIYRGLVIGTRMHVLVTRRMLRAAAARAERSAPTT